MVKTYQVALTGTVARLSTPLFAGDESKNIPFRQLLLQAAGGDGFLGSDISVTTGTGFKVAAGAAPMTIGPFETGPVKLSDFYGIGAGATLTILGVPF